MPIDLWFPTAVLCEDFALPGEIKAAALRAVDDAAPPPHGDPLGYRVTADSAAHTLHLDDRVRPLFGLIAPRLRRFFFTEMGFDPEKVAFFVGRCWPVVQTGTASGDFHNHAGAVFSAVFYLQTPPGSGGLKFQKPSLSAFDHVPRKRDNDKTFTRATYRAAEGRLILFGSHVMHTGLVNDRPDVGKRVAIAFDMYTVNAISADGGMPPAECLVRLA